MLHNVSADTSSRTLSTILITQLKGVADFASHEELLGIARRAMQLADDLSFAASEARQDQPRRLLAFRLMNRIEALAGVANPESLQYIAWQAMQVANDFSHALSETGGAQRRRLRRPADRQLPTAA